MCVNRAMWRSSFYYKYLLLVVKGQSSKECYRLKLHRLKNEALLKSWWKLLQVSMIIMYLLIALVKLEGFYFCHNILFQCFDFFLNSFFFLHNLKQYDCVTRGSCTCVSIRSKCCIYSAILHWNDNKKKEIKI